MEGVKNAARLGLTCLNVVNAEDSPITRVINEMDLMSEADDIWFDNENIGMYMKAGYCHSDIKSFMVQVICLSLVALWFSRAKGTSAK